MSLTSLLVYHDWNNRARRLHYLGRAQWYVALGMVVGAICLTLIALRTPLPNSARGLLTIGLSSVMYLMGATWILMVSAPALRRRLAVLYLLLAIAVLASALLSGAGEAAGEDSLTSSLLPLMLFPLVIVPLVVAAWTFRNPSVGLLPRAPDPTRVRSAIVTGVLVGSSIVVLLVVAGSYLNHGWSLHGRVLQATPLLGSLIYLCALRPIAEELFFRGLVLRQLHFHLNQSFWVATGLMLVLQLPLYILLASAQSSAGEVTLQLLAPSLLAVANSVLYVGRGTLLAPIVANVTVHLLVLLYSHAIA